MYPDDHGFHSLNVSAFGVAVTIRVADPAHLPTVEAILPPGSRTDAPGEALSEFTLDPDAAARDLAAAVAALDAELRRFIASHAPDVVFVHAGVVAHGGRAIVLPGRSFAGKSELVAALVREGAEYFSDEYAVLDAAGRVHPYPRPLSLRAHGAGVSAAELGGRIGSAPAPVGLIAVTRYVPRAGWDPATLTPAQGALLLLEHAGQATAYPDRVLDAVQLAARGALVLSGPRGEAGPAAAALLAAL
jgi:hypothetical protein